MEQSWTKFNRENIFHKNREISILMMKKKTARLKLPQEATERTKLGKIENKQKMKTHTGMNKSASLTPVQGPSTVVCMIVRNSIEKTAFKTNNMTTDHSHFGFIDKALTICLGVRVIYPVERPFHQTKKSQRCWFHGVAFPYPRPLDYHCGLGL